MNNKAALFSLFFDALKLWRDEKHLIALNGEKTMGALARQLVDSERRIRFVQELGTHPISEVRTDPLDQRFDPLRAAIYLNRHGETEEALWHVFIATIIGKNKRAKWRTSAQILAGPGPRWSYARVVADTRAFCDWLDNPANGITRHVGNHRKYLSIAGWKRDCLGSAASSYIELSSQFGGQERMFNALISEADENDKARFDYLYKRIKIVRTLGRTGAFDLLCMLGNLGLVDVKPESLYLVGATGPRRGALELFRGADITQLREIDKCICDFASSVGLSPQAMEDSICNWQKSPELYIPFRN